jgi:hypothetical protein
LGAELRRSSALLLPEDSQSEVSFSGLYVKRIGKDNMSRDESGVVVCGRLRENMGGEWQPGGIARGPTGSEWLARARGQATIVQSAAHRHF